MLVGGVQPPRELRAQLGVALEVGGGRRVVVGDEAPRDDVERVRRLVGAREPRAQLVLLGTRQLPERLHDRARHARAVVHRRDDVADAARVEALPAQAQVKRGARRHLPFVLREEGEAHHPRVVRLVDVELRQPRRREVELQPVLGAAAVRPVPADDERVAGNEGEEILAARGDAVVGGVPVDGAMQDEGLRGIERVEQRLRRAVVVAHAELHLEPRVALQPADPREVGARIAALRGKAQVVRSVQRRGAEKRRRALVELAAKAVHLEEALGGERVLLAEIPVEARREPQVLPVAAIELAGHVVEVGDSRRVGAELLGA